MIGQKENIATIKKWRLNRTTPRFILISGEGERLELAKYIGKSINANIVIVGKSAEEVRTVVDNSYSVSETTLYIFEHGDDMSSAATNSILKITEEPPNNSFFIILCEDKDNTLATIRSRSYSLELSPYSKEDLKELSSDSMILAYCTTPEQVRQYKDDLAGFKEFIKWCEKVANNITTMTGLESFRVGQKLKYKDTETGYDPLMFITIATNELVRTQSLENIYKILELSTKAIKDLKHKSIRKESTVDLWTLDIRRLLRNEATS